MNNQKQQLNINIDIKNTQPVVSEDGNQVFAEGVLLRKISRFVTGTQEDGIIPVTIAEMIGRVFLMSILIFICGLLLIVFFFMFSPF